jgi:hypothetical protein
MLVRVWDLAKEMRCHKTSRERQERETWDENSVLMLWRQTQYVRGCLMRRQRGAFAQHDIFPRQESSLANILANRK